MVPVEVKSGFKIHFFTDCWFLDVLVTGLTDVYSFDIVRFDDWLIKKHGYQIEIHGSMADFITLKFGIHVKKFVGFLIGYRGSWIKEYTKDCVITIREEEDPGPPQLQTPMELSGYTVNPEISFESNGYVVVQSMEINVHNTPKLSVYFTSTSRLATVSFGR